MQKEGAALVADPNLLDGVAWLPGTAAGDADLAARIGGAEKRLRARLMQINARRIARRFEGVVVAEVIHLKDAAVRLAAMRARLQRRRRILSVGRQEPLLFARTPISIRNLFHIVVINRIFDFHRPLCGSRVEVQKVL
jgi:hypothetical protein